MRDSNGGRQFLDTNVIVYAHDVSAGENHALAKALIKDLWESGKGCVSIQVLQEFYVTVVHKAPKPLPAAVASQIIADLSQWHVHSPAVDDILKAINVYRRYKLSFWDGLILRSAQALGCDVIWTEDFNHGQRYDGVTVMNPFLNRTSLHKP
jgi:predicted nucleic acid-binding protein